MDVADPPATKLLGLAGDALIVKSPPTLRDTKIEWVSDPLVPVTLIEYSPDGVEVEVPMVRTVLPDEPGERATFASVKAAVRPRFEGTDKVRWTVDPKPRLFNEIVEVAELPARTFAG